jgi:hypothetical protein
MFVIIVDKKCVCTYKIHSFYVLEYNSRKLRIRPNPQIMIRWINILGGIRVLSSYGWTWVSRGTFDHSVFSVEKGVSMDHLGASPPAPTPSPVPVRVGHSALTPPSKGLPAGARYDQPREKP